MTDHRKVRLLFLQSIIVPTAIALWMHELRVDVGGRESVRIFLSLFLFDDYTAALLMMAVAVMSLVPGLQCTGLAVVRWCGQRPCATSVLTAASLAVGSIVVYRAHPLAMDEYAAVFQSTVFASGKLFGELPPALLDWLIPPGFQGHFFRASDVTGQVASLYWPGFAAILSPFTLLGVTWLANPLLGGLLVYLVHRLALRLTESKEAAGLAALIAVASPAVTINAISLYSMTAHALCNIAFVLLLLRPTVPRALLAGAIGSVALVLHNPLPHMLVALPWLVWLLARRDRNRVVPAALIGYLPLSVLVGFGWPHLVAQIPVGAVASVAVPPAAQGFIVASIERLLHVGIFRLPTLDLLEDRLMAIAKMWLWAVPGLLILAMSGARNARSDVRCRLLAWSAISTLLGFLFVPADQGHGWGFRYFHAAWFVLPVLAVLAVGPIGNRGAATPESAAKSSFLGYVAASAMLSLTVLTGLRAFQVERFVERHLAQIPAVSSGAPEVVLIRWQEGYYAADLVQNDPFLRTRPLRMISHGDREDVAMLNEAFPGLRLLVSGPTASVWGYPAHVRSD